MVTFERLSDILEERKIVNKIDIEIITKILEAERDWNTEIVHLNEFLIILKDEVKGKLTEVNLRKKQLQYSKNGFISSTWKPESSAWKSESIASIIDVIKLTERTELDEVFNDIITRYNLGN